MLIPYRSQSEDVFRERDFFWIEQRWKSILPDAQICIGTNDAHPFNRGAAINDAYRYSAGDTLIISDADSFVPKKQIDEALWIMQKDAAPWVIPYREYYNLTKETTEHILKQPPNHEPEPLDIWVHRITTAVSGCLVVPIEFFEDTHGFDERFVGWGYEDNAYQMKLDVMYSGHARIPGPCLHLWHEEGPRFKAPWIQTCKDLYDRYAAATDPEQMCVLIDETPEL